MATTATKSIAARLPFDEYVRVLNQATEAKLTVSDYLILKLSASDRVAQAEAQQVALTQQVKQLKLEAQKQANLANEQQIALKREILQLQKQADTNQQNQQTALEKERVQLKNTTKNANDWQAYSNTLLKANTVLEQRIETHEQTLDQQQDELAQLKVKNGHLTSENQKLQRESSVVKAELAALKQQGISLWDNLAAEHNNQLFGKMPDRYWVILDAFKHSLKARP